MRTTRILYHRHKRGVSTVLGALIFVGILFSAVLPMYLVMRQADTIYDQTMFEMEHRDEERAREKLYVCAYPSSNSSELKLLIKNRGDPLVKIIRAWVNDDYHSQDVVIQSMEDCVLGPFPVSLQDESYYAVKVTTERGNIFSSAAGVLYYSDGIWYTPELSVSVTILNNQGQYSIQVANETWTSEGIIHGDFIKTFEVNDPGVYTVTMKRKVSGQWKELSASPAVVEITWPDGPPIAFVFAEGDKIK